MISNFETAKEASWFRNVGSSPLECWYGCGIVSQPWGQKSTSVCTFDTFFAIPFYSGRGGTIDTMAIEVSAAAALSTVRFGIYTSGTNYYPSSLVIDSGEFDSSTVGVKSASVAQALQPGNLYWAAILAGTASPTLRAYTNVAMNGFLGRPSTLGTYSSARAKLSATQTYGSLPSTFPSGATPSTSPTTAVPIMALRFSA